MTDTPSAILLLRLQSTGSNTNLWGGYLNTAMQTIEQASKGYQTLNVTGDATISWTNYATGNTGQCAHLKLTGSLTSPATLTFPAYQNRVLVNNQSGQSITIKCSGGSGVTVPNNRRAQIRCDGTDYTTDTPTWTGDSLTLTNNGDLVTNAQLAAAVAALSGATISGLLLNSAADTTASYNTFKNKMASDSLLTYVTQNAGANEYQELSDRRTRRRSLFVGQV